jgi:hypothetical protein
MVDYNTANEILNIKINPDSHKHHITMKKDASKTKLKKKKDSVISNHSTIQLKKA